MHHLVYRDTNPWSYKPEELIVLCEDCHKKRHGIMQDPEPANDFTNTQENRQQSYQSNHRSSSNNYERDPYIYPMESNKRFSNKQFLFGVLLLFALFIGVSKWINSNSVRDDDVQQESVQLVDDNNCLEPIKTNTVPQHKPKTRKDKLADKDAIKKEVAGNESNSLLSGEEEEKLSPAERREEYGSLPEKVEAVTSKKEMSTLELLEKRQHEDVVKQAKRTGVSAEGSTIDILERIQHADVVKQAKRAGVSTEGSTIEILERIQRKELEKYNKRY